MDQPSPFAREFVRHAAGPGVSFEPLHGGKSGSRVFRLRSPAGESLVLKTLEPDDVADHLRQSFPSIAVIEYRFYTEFMDRLAIPGPKILAAGRSPAGGCVLLMEDLAQAHRILPEDHVWSGEEMCSVLSAYALLHGRSWRLFQRESVPDWLGVDSRLQYDPALVLECLRRLAETPLAAELAGPVYAAKQLPDLAQQIRTALDDESPVLLYCDFYPPNVAIPEAGGPAKLFDWQLAASGAMQCDLVNIGLLGGGDAFARVNPGELLETYLDQFAEEAGFRPDPARFRAECQQASLLEWGVFLPRIVRDVEQADAAGHPLTPSMDRNLRTCLKEWADVLNG